MSTITNNLELVKYDASDKITPVGYNQNFDKIDDAIGNLSVDYIVSQGEQDGWYYRRWKSGFIELDYTFEMTSTGQGYVAFRKDYPFPFKKITSAQATLGYNTWHTHGVDFKMDSTDRLSVMCMVIWQENADKMTYWGTASVRGFV